MIDTLIKYWPIVGPFVVIYLGFEMLRLNKSLGKNDAKIDAKFDKLDAKIDAKFDMLFSVLLTRPPGARPSVADAEAKGGADE